MGEGYDECTVAVSGREIAGYDVGDECVPGGVHGRDGGLRDGAAGPPASHRLSRLLCVSFSCADGLLLVQ